MGTFDIDTILGNRTEEQNPFNFDNCYRDERNGDEKPLFKPSEIYDKASNDVLYVQDEIDEKFNEMDENDEQDYESNELKAIELVKKEYRTQGKVFGDLENNRIILEFLFTDVPTDFENEKKDEDNYYENKNMSNHEKMFLEIYPKVTRTELRECFSNCVDYVLSPEFQDDEIHPSQMDEKKYKLLKHQIPFINCYRYGTFKLTEEILNTDDDYDEPCGTLEDFKKLFNIENGDIFVRVWHRQAWEGLVEPSKFTPSLISDEALCYYAFELGINKPENKLQPDDMTRNEIWNWCKKEINNRFFKK